MLGNNLYKDRSYSSCIHAAYELLSNNFTTIFKKTWIVVLLYSIIFALTPLTNGIFSTTAIMVALFVSKCLIDTIILSLLNNKNYKTNFKAIVQVALFNLVLFVLFASLFVYANDFILLKVKSMASNLHLVIIFELLTIIVFIHQPLMYSNMKYLVQGDKKYPTIIKQNYKYGWKYLGFTSAVLILISIISIAIFLFIAMPLMISAITNQQNTIGVIMGDANGLPSYYNLLNFTICAIATFFANYLAVWWMFVMYYVYGNIEARCIAKNKNIQKYDE